MSVSCDTLVTDHNITKLNGQPTIWLSEITEADWTHIPEYVYFLVFLGFMMSLFAYLMSRRRSLMEENEERKQSYLNSLTSGNNAIGTLKLMKYCIDNDIQYNDISELNIIIQSRIQGDEENENPPILFEKHVYKYSVLMFLYIWIISVYAMLVYPYCIASYKHWDESYKSYVEIECVVFSESRSKELYPEIEDERLLYQFLMDDLCDANTTQFYSTMHYPAQFYDNDYVDFDAVNSDTPCYLNKDEFNVRGRYRPCCGCECSRCGRAMRYSECCGQQVVQEQIIASCYCLSFCCAPCICLSIRPLFRLFDAVIFEGYELTIGNVEQRTSLRVNDNNNTVESTIKIGESNKIQRTGRKRVKETASKSETMHLNQQTPEHEEVREWFRDTVKLEQYGELFIDNGFEDLEFIKTINENMLTMMGIKKLGHRTRIMQCVDQLNGRNDPVKDEPQLEMAGSDDRYRQRHRDGMNGRSNPNQTSLMAFAVDAGAKAGETAYI
eukprot:488871_1